ncbi:uncharacterized protein LOC119084365 isoform X1 [Bradysia coprophila]|uniref:uncharacterized protein LOC119084365 isoform X1 n=1 Tax=Bradysia coprophila TaxID=38358 RepID=UPI00187DCE20|nr:uncharacterized protein LOC119084365 isoform X1 [Bradysia coprophila]XP_037050207.1 uncharacterized protein LOC119084365 isoform X1 [Bradysia coprophila]
MDIKPYEEKLRELQGHLPFLETITNSLIGNDGKIDIYKKFIKLHKLITDTLNGDSSRMSLETIIKVDRMLKEVMKRSELKAIEPMKPAAVKIESDRASVSETPDSPSPPRHYERTSPIEIPTERSDNREIKKERDSHRYEDNRRYRSESRTDHQRPAVDKYGASRYDGGDRNRSRYDAHHERSKSRDSYRSDRREGSDSSDRYGKNDRDRDRRRYDDRDSRDNSWKKYDQRVKTERSDRYSPSSQRGSGVRPSTSGENDSHKSAFDRLGARPSSTTTVSRPSNDDGLTDAELAEMRAKTEKSFGCDSDGEEVKELRNLMEVRSKLATQMRLAESIRKKEKPTSTASSEAALNKMSLNPVHKKAGSRFEVDSLRESSSTPPNSQPKECFRKFSFAKTLAQPKRTTETVTDAHMEPKSSPINIDDDIIKKIVAQPMKPQDRIIPPAIQGMNFHDIKQALETAKQNQQNQQRLALKYNPKAKPRSEQNTPEATVQKHQQHQPDPSHPNNLQLVCVNDPRVSRARDPRVQVQQQDLRLQSFSPPSTPPCLPNPNYLPVMQPSGYKQSSYPTSNMLPAQNHFPSQQNVYHSTISPQHHLQSQSNLISITPHATPFNNHRNPHRASPVSSSDVSPPPRYQYQQPSYPEPIRNTSGIHNKFRPTLNDNVERQKYEQSRNRRSSDYFERETPQTYGEYRRSLNPTVSSTSEKSERGNSETRSATVSTSHHDKVYRSGNYATPIPSVTTQPTGSKFKIPKKSTSNTARPTPVTVSRDSKDSEDEQWNARLVRDSDDSEYEAVSNAETVVISDCETSDNIRDPRMRAQALRKTSTSSERKTKETAEKPTETAEKQNEAAETQKETAEKQNNVVTSSTSIVPESVPSGDNMEFLKHLTNPNNLLALINLVGQMSDDATFTKVKEVLEKAKESNATPTPVEENQSANLAASTTKDKVDVPKTPRKKSKNELEKLNEDIRTMFISDGVLNATGRRVCALYNNAADAKEAAGAKSNRPVKRQAKDDVSIPKEVYPEGRITRRRNTMVCHPSTQRVQRSAPRDTDVTKEQQSATPEAPKSTAPTQRNVIQESTTSTPPVQKTANVKGAKAKKQPQPEPEQVDEPPPTKRITRAQLKECNIVLEKLSPDASVESLTNLASPKKDGRGKRARNEEAVKKTGVKKAKKAKMIMKNIDPNVHSLKKIVDCPVCEKPAKLSIVNHFVTWHPDSEVYTCRLAPEVADALRNSKHVTVAEQFQPEGRCYKTFSHICYFCNVTKSLTKVFWMNHMSKHTGYYQYQCNDCSRQFAEKNKAHACKGTNNLAKIPQPQFEIRNKHTLMAYICDLCNFVRFHQADIEKHLRCEHETTDTKQFKEVVFLSFPKRQRKGHEAEEEEEEEEDVSESSDEEEIVVSSSKRRKIKADTDDKDVPDVPAKKVLRSRVLNTEAFISEPKEDDGLFDKDTMKLMKDMSFSASKDGECTARSNRAKSIAEKLSERFNSVQEDSASKLEETETKATKTEPLDPLTCDEGIPIVRVTASENCQPSEETIADTTTDVQMELKITNVTTVTDEKVSLEAVKDDNCIPPEETEEAIDESDDNWESYSSEDSDGDSAEVAEAEEPSVAIQRQPNRKNTGIIDTIARLQQSISSQGTGANVEATEKTAEAASSDENVKDEAKRGVDTKKAENKDTIEPASVDGAELSDKDKVESLTHDTAASEPMEVDTENADGCDKVKKCVSNGRSSNGNFAFNLMGTVHSVPQFGSHSYGGSSSNAAASNNDVDMVDVNKPAKILTRIDNIGYTRSPDGGVSFCCLIDNCGFESVDLTNLLYHIDDHVGVQWYGYCFTCNDQIETEQVQLMMEFRHMTTAHYQKKDENESGADKATAGGKPTFIKCKMLPGDKLSKLKEEEEIAAKAAQLITAPSTSTSATRSRFIKITNVRALTDNMKSLSAIDAKPEAKETSVTMPKETGIPTAKETGFTISKVVSLGSTSREYSDNELVSLKGWGNNPTNKLQKNCKKMLRDICLYALFKCMDINCIFTTDNADHMLTHLRNHEKNMSNEAPSWLECAYCDIVADSCTLLVKHIQDEHQSSIFQCPYCFYRSCAAFNVVVHLKLYHPKEKKSVLVCNGKPRMYATEKALIEKSRKENIRPLRCTEDCHKITYVMDHFVNHMKNSPSHTDKFKCQFCGFNTLVSETSKHLLVHSVGVYECVYCHYGINDVDSIQNHMCNTHPSKLLYICVRLTRKDRAMTDEQLSSVESTLIVLLGQTVDKGLFQRCPFTDEQLSFMDPAVSSNAMGSIAVAPSTPTPTSSNVTAAPLGLNISSVTSIPSELFANPTETITASKSGLMLNDILSYKDLERDYMHEDWDKYFATLTVPSKTVPRRKSSATQAVVELPDNKKATTSSATSRTDLVQEEIDNAAYVLVKGTGLEGPDLYRCSFSNCDERSDDIFIFNVHLLKHSQVSVGFKCYHCQVVSKNIVGLKYHIKVHGIHRYFCYFCNYTSAIVNDIQKHMQDTHSKNHVNTIPLNPKKNDQNKDMFVMCPRGLRQEELNRFGIALINRNKRQQTSSKKYYSPEDIDFLPRDPIFKTFIFCEVCNYSTQVRSNLTRHLAAHKDEKSVSKVDPVNPVPCLDTGEKHFDKMINLACSSNDTKTASAQYDSSVFIPENRRFVCNARNCQYQNISENMLMRHLTTLHPSEEHYKCPHCNVLICQKMDAEKVSLHLRMHDTRIFKCPKCMFAHYVKSAVDKHRDESHQGVVDQAILITRDETTTSLLDGQPKVSKWKCSLCNDLFATQKHIQAHIQTSHSIKFQYQCDICPEVQSNNKTTIQEHINAKHPNQSGQIKVYYKKVECVENDNTPIWRRDDPNKIKHIRGILFEEENVRTTPTKRDQFEVKKKTSQKKRSDKPVVEQNISDIGDVPVVEPEPEQTKSTDDRESNAIVIVSDEDTADLDKSNGTGKTPTSSTVSHPIPSTSKNLFESGKSLMGSSNTPIKPSQTVVRAEATSSGIKANKEPSLDKTYLCGRCCKYSDNTIALVRAHQATAHPNVQCEIFMRNTNDKVPEIKGTTKLLPDATNVSSKPKLTDCISYGCHHCIFKSQQPEIIYKHWKENHKHPKITTKNIEFPSRPFFFRIARTFQCCYCRRSSHFKDLKVHCLRSHPYESFAMINNLEPKKCALCVHEFSSADINEVIKHFKTSHKNLTSTEPDIHLTDELIDEVTSVLPREQVKCTQSNCNTVFFTMAELEEHHTLRHSGSQKEYVSIPNDPIMYGCSIFCKDTATSEPEMVAHIRSHINDYQCNFCEKRFDKLEMVKVHHEIMHDSKDETYRNVDVKEHLSKYSAMKIIFPNGLVLTKSDAKHTKYGSMDDAVKLVTEMNEKDLEVVRKRQKEHSKKEPEPNAKVAKDAKDVKEAKHVKPLVIKKKDLKRHHILDSESDSDNNPSELTATPTRTLRKKRKAYTETVVPPKSSDHKSKIDSTSNSDDNTPLKQLIPSLGSSFVRSSPRKAKPTPLVPSEPSHDSKSKVDPPSTSDDSEPLQQLVPLVNLSKKTRRSDLSKLFIDMPFGDSIVKVSCDRFSLLFNISPKLRLKRCDRLVTK